MAAAQVASPLASDESVSVSVPVASSDLLVDPSPCTVGQRIRVLWHLDNSRHRVTPNDEVRVLHHNGSVASRAPVWMLAGASVDPVAVAFGEDRETHHVDLQTGALTLMAPASSGAFLVVLYSFSSGTRILSTPLCVVDDPAAATSAAPSDDDNLACIQVTDAVGSELKSIHPGQRLNISVPSHHIISGTLVVCPVARGTNDGRLTSSLFASASRHDQTGRYATPSVYVINPVPPSALDGTDRHMFAVFAPSPPLAGVPAQFHVQLLKTTRHPMPHAVASSNPFTVLPATETQVSSLALRATQDFDEAFNMFALKGSLTVTPTMCFPGQPLRVAWDFSTCGDGADESVATTSVERGLWHLLSETDSVNFFPFGRRELRVQTESAASCVRQVLLRGSLVVQAPNVPGLFDCAYNSFHAQLPLLVSTTAVRVVAPVCVIEPTHAVVALSDSPVSATAEAGDAARQLPARISFVVSEAVLTEHDSIVIRDESAAVVARLAVPAAACRMDTLTMRDYLALTSLRGDDIARSCSVEELMCADPTLRVCKGSVFLTENPMVAFNIQDTRCTATYWSALLQRDLASESFTFGSFNLNKSCDTVDQTIITEIRVDLITPLEVPLGEAIRCRVRVLNSADCSSWMLTKCLLCVSAFDEPACRFRGDEDDAAAIPCLSAAFCRWYDCVPVDRLATFPPISEPGAYVIRFYRLPFEDACGSMRICVAECAVVVHQSMSQFQPLQPGALVVENRSPVFSRRHPHARRRKVASSGDEEVDQAMRHHRHASRQQLLAEWVVNERPDFEAPSAEDAALVGRSTPISRSRLLVERGTRGGNGELQQQQQQQPLLESEGEGLAALFDATSAAVALLLPTEGRTSSTGNSRPTYRGTIAVTRTVETSSVLVATLHVLSGPVNPLEDKLLLVDDTCSHVLLEAPLSAGLGRPDGTLVTVSFPRIPIPGVYFVIFYSGACGAAALVSAPVTVTLRRGSDPRGAMVLAAARRLEAGMDAEVATALEALDLRRKRPTVKALLVSCCYHARPFELKAPINDLCDVFDCLRDDLGLHPDNIAILHDVPLWTSFSAKTNTPIPSTNESVPTAVNIRAALSRLVDTLQSGDTALFYFSGLGTTFAAVGSEHAQKALLPIDFDWSIRALSYAELMIFALAAEARGATPIIIVDASFHPNVLDIARLTGRGGSGEGNIGANSNASRCGDGRIKRISHNNALLPCAGLTNGHSKGTAMLVESRLRRGVAPDARWRALLPPTGLQVDYLDWARGQIRREVDERQKQAVWTSETDNAAPNGVVVCSEDVCGEKHRWHASYTSPSARYTDEKSLPFCPFARSLCNVRSLSRRTPCATSPRLAKTVLYEAGRLAAWEAPNLGSADDRGASRGAFTRALCSTLRQETVVFEEEERVALFRLCRHRSIEEVLAAAAPENSTPRTGAPSWERLHFRVLSELQNTPYGSQKPNLFVPSAETLVSSFLC